MYLNQFGKTVYDAFGHVPYLVGSAAIGKNWRDVDVRIMMPDEEFWKLFPNRTQPMTLDKKWVAICMAFSELGRRMTELPIDFQIQSDVHGNGTYPMKEHPRHSLILYL